MWFAMLRYCWSSMETGSIIPDTMSYRKTGIWYAFRSFDVLEQSMTVFEVSKGGEGVSNCRIQFGEAWSLDCLADVRSSWLHKAWTDHQNRQMPGASITYGYLSIAACFWTWLPMAQIGLSMHMQTPVLTKTRASEVPECHDLNRWWLR